MMTVEMQSRIFGPIVRLPLTYSVERFSWGIFGGPKALTFHADGPRLDAWELFERLRCPVTIYSERGKALWWGYVNEVQVRDKQVEAAVSLESMQNRVAVAYTRKTSGSSSAGQRATTAWLEDDASVAKYGQRELLASSSGSTDAQALIQRANLLRRFKDPQPTTIIKPPTQSAGQQHAATLLCRGWWSTLEWKYYQNLLTTETDTGAQLAAMLTASGQFFTSVEAAASGIVVNQFKDGDGSAATEALELLKGGTANAKRLLASVDEHRRVQVYEEPDLPAAPMIIQPDGTLRMNGERVPNETCPVGAWARIRDAIPGSVDTSGMADPSLVFIDEAEYTVADDWYNFSPRGKPTAADLMKTAEG